MQVATSSFCAVAVLLLLMLLSPGTGLPAASRGTCLARTALVNLPLPMSS
jgi:uncharacterized MnhB-related membrane protein